MILSYLDGVEVLSKYLDSRKIGERSLVAVCGGSCSGKSSLARDVLARVNTKRVTLIAVDSYSTGVSAQEGLLDFDSPQSYDIPLLTSHINLIADGADMIRVPTYDAAVSARRGYSETMISNLVIVEGLYAIQSQFLEAINLPVFVETTEGLMIERRVSRGAKLHGTDRETILNKMEKVVLPNYRKNIYPLKRFASVVISNNM